MPTGHFFVEFLGWDHHWPLASMAESGNLLQLAVEAMAHR